MRTNRRARYGHRLDFARPAVPLANQRPRRRQVKPSPGLDVLGRGARVTVAPHLREVEGAALPAEVICCGGLAQASVQLLVSPLI